MRSAGLTVLVVACLGLLAGARPVAAQIEGTTYTDPAYGYTVTWDASWIVLDPPTVPGEDALALGSRDRSVAVLFFTSAAYAGDSLACVRGFADVLATEADDGEVDVVTAADGSHLTGGDAGRAHALYRFDRGGVAMVDRVECATLEPGGAVLVVLAVMPAAEFAAQRPRVEALLAGLVLPDAGDQPAPAATPPATPAGRGGEAAPAFVADRWRVAVVAAQRGEALLAVGLESTGDGDWLVVVADVTNWGADDATLGVGGFGVRLSDRSQLRGVDAAATAAVAARLGTEPAEAVAGVAIAAGQTRRVALAFRLPAGGADPALARSGDAVPLVDALAARADVAALPQVAGPPPLVETRLLRPYGGGRWS